MKSLHRAIDLLSAFQSRRELSVEELAKILGWPASSVYRFVRVLRDRGFLSLVPEGKKYSLGSLLCELGRAGGPDLPRLARAALERLAKETGESSFLSIRGGWEARYAACVESPESIRFTAPIGRRFPLYAGASGKVILAFMEEEERRAYLRTVRLKQLCSSTIVDKARLEKALSVIRSRGYDFSQQERHQGAWGLAAPILNEKDAAIGSIAITGIRFRLPQKKLPRFISLLKEAAGEVSGKLKNGRTGDGMKTRSAGS
ncbi:MAG: IclR family transcriptional regulator [Deltaproteobacteria bacterium]|nr:IclR family transcriptional regulator [Deltaproteobacteria bacterium]MBI2992267.1 IclR family transcriptional regulator [Deltaproteobacteria bacterium]